jgi:hypothetical protein
MNYFKTLIFLILSTHSLYAWKITEIISPFPPHCVSENQWINPYQENPMNLFDNKESIWKICDFAVETPGYTIDFKLDAPIEIDEIRISRDSKAKRKIEKLDVLFYLSDLSTKHPYLVQEFVFYEDQQSLVFKGLLPWNPRLRQLDKNLDSKREALGLDSKGLQAPIKFDKIGFVIRELSDGTEAVGLQSISLRINKKELVLENEQEIRNSHAEFIGKAYQYIIQNNILISLNDYPNQYLFADTGAIWYKGELNDKLAKILKLNAKKKGEWSNETLVKIGDWKFENQHIEVAELGKKKFTPLVLWIDEAPKKIKLIHEIFGGEFKVMTPTTLKLAPDVPEEESKNKTEFVPQYELP